jgi:protein SCO1/2
MNATAHPSSPPAVRGLRRLGGAAGSFLSGPGLAVFVTTSVIVYEVFLLAVIFAPGSLGAWSAFSEEFKIWCFNYDPRTGGMEWMAVVIMLAEPAFIAGLLLGLARFCRARQDAAPPRARFLRAASAGFAVGLAACVTLYAYGRPDPDAEVLPPFPGERIRTQIVPPDFRLTDHRGASAGLADFRGKAVLLTGVYTLCSTSCPEILVQLHELVAGLPAEAKANLQLAALSLNPEYDTAALMGAVAEAYGLDYPGFRFLNGDPFVMAPLLRDLQFSPRRNPETGLIDHANLFILLDAEGRIAYRFNLDRRHRDWLRAAVLALTAEAAGAGA